MRKKRHQQKKLAAARIAVINYSEICIMENQYLITSASNHRPEIVELLQSEKLPVDDLPEMLGTFYTALQENKVIGAIGFEKYGGFGLLRSMVVDRNHRNKNIASALVGKLEEEAARAGIESIYLLTQTADQYFAKKGYKKIERDSVPEPVRASREFIDLCPASAIVMMKNLTPQ